MPVFKSGNLLLDTDRRTLQVITKDVPKDVITGSGEDANNIAIAPLTWSVLAELLVKAPSPVSIDVLNQQCWKNTVVSDETVVQRIALLRKTLEKNGVDAASIENIRGQGYRWVPAVNPVESYSFEQSTVKHKNKSSFMWAGAVFVASLSVLALSLWFIESDVSRPETMPTQTQELLRQAHSYRQKFDAQSMSYAVSLYEQTLQRMPDNVAALAGLAMAKSHQISKFNHDPGNMHQVIDIAKLALELAPRDPFVLQANGLVRDIQGDIAGAIDLYDKALQLNPDEASLYGDLAYLHTIKGEFTRAFDFHLKGLPGQQQFRQSQLALWFRLLGENASSQYWYQQAILLNPHNLTDKLGYLDGLLKIGQVNVALEFASELQKQGIDDYRIQLANTKALALLGDKKAALDTVVNGLALQPDHAELLIWLQILDKDYYGVREFESAWQFYTELQYPWPEHYVQMALFTYNKQDVDTDSRDDKSVRYIKLAVENGYREGSWLKALVDNNWLPDTPKVRQLLNGIDEAIDAERQLLMQNHEYQQLLNQTARAIVSG